MINNLLVDGNFWQIILSFIIYWVIGWVWESLYRSIRLRRIINSGFLVGPYIPIYGFGAMLFVILLHFTTNPIELFFIGGISAMVLEYFTSWLLEVIFHARWWDYTGRFGNINGRVTLSSFLAFGFFAMVMPYVHQQVSGVVASIPDPWLEIIVIVMAFFMISDTITTCSGLARFNKVLRRYQKEIDRHTARFLDFVRKGRQSFEMRFTKGDHRARSVLTYIQRRTIMTFPSFNSTLYPEAFKRIEELFATVNQKFKDTQYKPKKSKTKKKPASS